jgi:hypothetical protein
VEEQLGVVILILLAEMLVLSIIETKAAHNSSLAVRRQQQLAELGGRQSFCCVEAVPPMAGLSFFSY